MKSFFNLYVLHLTLVTCALAFNHNDPFDAGGYSASDVIDRDVVVVGGGSSGTYGAINLRKLGQSVILVEKQAVLGGHTNSYTDPATGVTLDYGVQAFWNISVTRDYFAHLNISTSTLLPGSNKQVYVDFQTGNPVNVKRSGNYTAWANQLDKYPYLEYSWDLPYPVPEDLLLPFGDFIEKYNFQSLAYDIYFNGQGFSNVLQQLTVNVMKIVDGSFLDALAGGDVVTSNHDNGEIYTKALAELGTDVLLSTTVVDSQRPSASNGSSSSGIRLVVETPSGRKLIRAAKLLVSIPPLLDNMQPFDLDVRETNLFSQWKFSGYYTMLINNTGLPSGFQFINGIDAIAGTYDIPPLPAPYQVTETRIPGLFYIWYGSPYNLTQAEVEADVTSVVQRLQKTTNSSSTTKPEFVEFRSHTPFKLVVSADAISNGFYKQLEGLQGYRSTWYTGAAFISHSSGILWNFTQSLLPDIVAA